MYNIRVESERKGTESERKIKYNVCKREVVIGSVGSASQTVILWHVFFFSLSVYFSFDLVEILVLLISAQTVFRCFAQSTIWQSTIHTRKRYAREQANTVNFILHAVSTTATAAAAAATAATTITTMTVMMCACAFVWDERYTHYEGAKQMQNELERKKWLDEILKKCTHTHQRIHTVFK